MDKQRTQELQFHAQLSTQLSHFVLDFDGWQRSNFVQYLQRFLDLHEGNADALAKFLGHPNSDIISAWLQANHLPNFRIMNTCLKWMEMVIRIKYKLK